MVGVSRMSSRVSKSGSLAAICWLVLVFLLLVPITHCFRTKRPLPIGGRFSSVSRPALLSSNTSILLDRLRGGGDAEDEYEDDQDDAIEEYDDEGESSTLGGVLQLSMRAVALVGKATFKVLKASTRAIKAAFSGEETSVEQDSDDSSVLTKFARTVRRMWRAAFSTSDATKESKRSVTESENVVKEPSIKEMESFDESESRQVDFGTFLSKSYQVEATRDDLDNTSPILSGTISEALRTARSQCRLLFVFIPSVRPGKGASADLEAIRGFLSAEVAAVAERRARKNQASGSFLLWSAKAGSPEAVVAMKRLKAQQVNSKGQKRPILLVAFPAQVVDGRGQAKIVPKSLAQHHCSPPPSPETMAAWLNALRKRHAKQYANMQLGAREAQYLKERKEGYKDSIQSDKERQEREKREEAERIAKEKAEKERLEAIKLRREELRESLPKEPSKDEPDSKMIALRLPDGRSIQRRFAADTELAMVFNWADVSLEMERETIVLTTMNGKMSFSWDDGDNSLDEAGLGRMAGLRVTEKKQTQKEESEEASS